MIHKDALLPQAIAIAGRLGYQVCRDWLDGCGGGLCESGGEKWIMVDRALTDTQQLSQILRVLRNDPRIFRTDLSPELRNWLDLRKSA